MLKHQAFIALTPVPSHCLTEAGATNREHDVEQPATASSEAIFQSLSLTPGCALSKVVSLSFLSLHPFLALDL